MMRASARPVIRRRRRASVPLYFLPYSRLRGRPDDVLIVGAGTAIGLMLGLFLAGAQEHNPAQPGQPSPDTAWYAAITAEFEPTTNPQLVPKELPGRLMMKLLDEGEDEMMGGPSDLVVGIASSST